MINKIARLIIHPFEIISMGIIEVVKGSVKRYAQN